LVFGVQVLVSRLVLRVEPTMQAAVLPSSHVVLMGGLMLFTLPESMQFLVLRGRRFDEVAASLRRIDPAFTGDGRTEYLDREQGPMGKTLDFIMQEMNREANTISSKAEALPICQGALLIKAEVEKIREQVQNLE